MICKNCGAFVNDDDLFCINCGTRVEQTNEAVVNPDSGQMVPPNDGIYKPQNPPKQQNNNKKIFLILGIVFGVIILVVGLIIGLKVHSVNKLKEPININIGDYITDTYMTDDDIDEYYDETEYDYNEYSYENYEYGSAFVVHGFDGNGFIIEEELFNAVDWEKFYNDLDAMIKQKKGYQNYDHEDFFRNDNISFSVDKTDGISNSDKITLTVSSSNSEFKYKDVTVSISSGTKSYDVSSLKEVTSLDPFKYVTVYARGANGYGTTYFKVNEDTNESIEGTKVKVKYESDDQLTIWEGDYIVAKLDFDFDSSSATYDLSNGDYVSLNCYTDDADSLIDKYDLYIAKNENTYTISGLGEYINKDFKMSEEDLKKFRKDAYTRVTTHLNSEDYSDVSFSCAYLADVKDTTTSSDVYNILYVVYSYNYTYWSGETEKRYACVEYHDLISYDGKISYSADSYYYDDEYSGDSVEELVTNSYDANLYNFRKL